MLGYKKLAKVNSPINGPINVGLVFGKPRIEIGTLLQSGSLVQSIWKKAVKRLRKYKDREIKEVLVLGLAGGTVVDELVKVGMDVKVTGIELDPELVKIGRKYFSLKKYEKQGFLKIIVGNAFREIDKLIKDKKSYDLIIYDLYLGRNFINPRNKDFVLKLKQVLNKKGIIVFNHFFWGKNKLRAKKLVSYLETEFEEILLSRVLVNLLIFASKKSKKTAS